MTTRKRTAPTRPDLADAAYARLAGAIATCEIPAGSPLNEREMAARLGMSRTPLRAALHRLSLEGLVTTVAKKGTHVTTLDARDVEDSTAVREALEVEMARRVIDAGIQPDDGALQELLAAQRHAVEHLDSPAFLRADEQFHLLLLAASGNHSAVDAAQRAWLHVNRARYTVPMTVADMRNALRGHREIAAAVAERSASRAERAIRAHLEEPLRRQLRWLAERPAEPLTTPPVLAAAARWGGLVRP